MNNFKETVEKQLKVLEQQTGVNSKILLGLGVVATLFVLVGYLDVYITNTIAILYPAFWSMKAIESPDANDDKQWLTYWVCFALFMFTDMFAGFLLRFIPFYFFFKLVFLVWLFLPNTRGALWLYDNVLSSYFKHYEKDITNQVNNLQNAASNAYKQGKDYVKENQAKIIAGGINATQKVVESVNKSE